MPNPPRPSLVLARVANSHTDPCRFTGCPFLADLIRQKGDTTMTVEQLTQEIIPRGRGASPRSPRRSPYSVWRCPPQCACPIHDACCSSPGGCRDSARRHQSRAAAADTQIRRAGLSHAFAPTLRDLCFRAGLIARPPLLLVRPPRPSRRPSATAPEPLALRAMRG